MSNYSGYDKWSFVTDARFQDWVLKGEGEEYWQEVIAEDPASAKEIEAAKEWLLSVKFAEVRPPKELVELYWEKTQRELQTEISKSTYRRLWVRWVVAATIVFMLFAGAWVVKLYTGKDKPALLVNDHTGDLVPGGDRAVLTLADGTTIVLDSARNGILTRQGSIAVLKLNDGQLAYNNGTSSTTKITYNTIATPPGGQYQLILSDGTKVWLNASSSLRFPVTFLTGKDREVELTGEGYFEVAKKVKSPFRVIAGDMKVKVLGTHFNVNAYDDEANIRTTLLEGRVEVSAGKEMQMLTPGQQARLDNGTDHFKVVDNIDTEEVMAWKNGYFQFNGADLHTILRQAARWYGAEVAFLGQINETFSGEMPRSENLSQLLDILKATGKVEFEISGKRILVKPKYGEE